MDTAANGVEDDIARLKSGTPSLPEQAPAIVHFNTKETDGGNVVLYRTAPSTSTVGIHDSAVGVIPSASDADGIGGAVYQDSVNITCNRRRVASPVC